MKRLLEHNGKISTACFVVALLMTASVIVDRLRPSGHHFYLTVAEECRLEYQRTYDDGIRIERARQRASCVEWIAVLRPTGEVPRTCPGGHVEFTPSTDGPVACCRCERSP